MPTRGYDFETIFTNLGALVRDVRTPAFSTGLEHLMRALFEPQSIVVLVFENRRRPVMVSEWIPDDKLRDVFEDAYFEHGYFLDPFYELAMSDFSDGAFRLREIAPDRFFRSEYCRIYFRLTRMVDEMGCLTRIDGERVAHLSLGRNQGHPKYKTREFALLKLIFPALMPLIAEHCKHISRPQEEHKTKPPGRALKDLLLYTKLPNGQRITKRESEIASLVVQGHSTSAIGLILDISPQTVKVHRRNMYRKLNISSQAELYAQFAG